MADPRFSSRSSTIFGVCKFAACTVCAQTKSSNNPPAGLLRPLPIPSRPWSHITLDFVTGLPSSSGNTVILTVVDRFSKAAHFIPLPKLPSALETAQIMVNHVFKIHGLPSDLSVLEGILSTDRGIPQSVVRIPSTDQWASREDQSDSWSHAA